jgi:hypothetical protein
MSSASTYDENVSIKINYSTMSHFELLATASLTGCRPRHLRRILKIEPF